MSIPRIIVSAGEPAGIGPDISLLAAQRSHDADILTVGDPELFYERAKQLGIDVSIEESDLSSIRNKTPKGVLKIVPVKLSDKCVCGELNEANANYVLNVLDLCINACQNNHADAMVTGPIQKSILNCVQANFSGHTEYLAEKTEAELPVMMLATEGLRVALVTTHVPLTKIASLITKKRVRQIIKILANDLREQFGINKPKILVTGLNPHAGENGHLGSEEVDVIQPVIEEFQASGEDIHGPYPADTLFTPKYLDEADAVLAMYHDQGLPVLKYKGFGNAINVTLGLPITRTSVDHGTALDLAGTGMAKPQSMLLALQSAIDIVKSRNT